MFNTKVRKFGALAFALLVLLSGVGGAAAAIAWDTESTDTTTTSDVDGTTTSLDIYYGDGTNTTYFEVDGAGTSNLTLQITPATDGVDYVVYKNETAETENDTAGHYSFTVSHDELANAPRTVDGATYDVQIINQSSGKEVLNQTDVTFNNAADSPKSVMVVTDQATDSGAAMSDLVSDRLTIETSSAGWLDEVVSLGAANDTTVATWSGFTTVDGTNTTVDVRLDNSSAADAYSAAAEDYEEGDWVRESTLTVNGVPMKVYKDSAPEGAEGTTVVYDSTADKLVVSPGGEDFQDVRTVQMRGAAGASYGFGELWSNFGAMAALESLIP